MKNIDYMQKNKQDVEFILDSTDLLFKESKSDQIIMVRNIVNKYYDEFPDIEISIESFYQLMILIYIIPYNITKNINISIGNKGLFNINTLNDKLTIQINNNYTFDYSITDDSNIVNVQHIKLLEVLEILNKVIGEVYEDII